MRDDTKILGDRRDFPATSWTLVGSARDREALDELVAVYWKPLYFFVRRQGYDNETAKDIVQDFLATLLDRDAIAKADPARGRFRTFLLSSLSNFLKDWSRSEHRQKRDAGRLIRLDWERGESEYRLEVAADDPPEVVLHRAWARALWERALARLEGDPAHLQAFRMYLEDADYATISSRTGLSETAAKTAVHRIKARLREILIDLLRPTVSSEADLQAEIDDFITHLSAVRE